MYINVYLSCQNASLSQKKKRNRQHYCSFLYLLRNDILKLIDNMHKICSLAESVHDSNDLDLVISHLVKIYHVISLLSYCLVIAVPSQPPQGVQATAINSRSIKVVWSPPPLFTLHGILQGYKIYYKPVRFDEGKI